MNTDVHVKALKKKKVKEYIPSSEEEASRALKTLRSSKAPLVKKRQVMRAMTGDYRKKMEEEKKRQHKLIQSGEQVECCEHWKLPSVKRLILLKRNAGN